MKKFTALMTSAAVFALLSGTAMAKPVEISFANWASTEASMKGILTVIEQFEKENPDIKIKNVPLPVSDIRNQVMIMVMGGNPPDIAQFSVGDAHVMGYMEAVHPAEELYSKAFIDDLYPEFYETCRQGDKHIAVDWSPNTLTFYYNKKLMAEAGLDPNTPPKTLDEMEAMMKKVKKVAPEAVGLQLDTTIRTVGFYHIWSFVNNFAIQPITNDSVAFNTPEMIEFGKWVRRMVKDGYTLPGKKFGEFRPLAAQDRLLFALDGPQFQGVIKSFDKNYTTERFLDTWGIAPLPSGRTGKNFSVPDDHVLVVLKSTKHKEAAAKFVEYLVSNKFALEHYQSPIGFLAPTKSAARDLTDAFGDSVRKAIMENTVPHIIPQPYGPNYVKIATIVMTAIQELISSDKPVDEIMNTAQVQLEGVIKK